MNSPSLLTPRQTAERLGSSYPTIKHWILDGRIRTIKTKGGHHRIPMDALQEFMPHASVPLNPPQISGRNQLLGTVSAVIIEALIAKVDIRVGNQTVTAIITSDAARELDFKIGDSAFALIRPTEVMMAKP